MAYLALYIERQWVLGLAGLKLMTPLVFVFDRPTYSKLVPDHLADLNGFPSDVIKCMEQGKFTVSFTPRVSHCVGLVEAQEMGINKGTKQLVVRPTEDDMQIFQHDALQSQHPNYAKVTG